LKEIEEVEERFEEVKDEMTNSSNEMEEFLKIEAKLSNEISK